MKPISIKTQKILLLIPFVNVFIMLTWLYNCKVCPIKKSMFFVSWFISCFITYLVIIPMGYLFTELTEVHPLFNAVFAYIFPMPLGYSLIWFQKKFGVPYSHTEGYTVIKGNLYSKDGQIFMHLKKRVNLLNLPDGVIAIEDYACQNSPHLKNITIPQGVTRIGKSAFEGCVGLRDMVIPSMVTSIGEYALAGCDDLKTLALPFMGESTKSHQTLQYLFGKSPIPLSLKTVTLQEGCTDIAEGAFSGCTGLTEIHLPHTLTAIGGRAFDGCTGLSTLDIPQGVTAIGYEAFKNCTGLQSLFIPKSVTHIEQGAFLGWQDNQTLYVAEKSRPDGWDSQWDSFCKAQVVWGDLTNDWRLTIKGGAQMDYLFGVELIKHPFVQYSETWDHDHCEFCWAKFSHFSEDLHKGYTTKDKHHWICDQCYNDFSNMFKWKVVEETKKN